MSMVDKHNVEYIFTGDATGDATIKASMTQKDLAKLLLRDDVILLNVNKPKVSYRRKNGRNKK